MIMGCLLPLHMMIGMGMIQDQLEEIHDDDSSASSQEFSPDDEYIDTTDDKAYHESDSDS